MFLLYLSYDLDFFFNNLHKFYSVKSNLHFVSKHSHAMFFFPIVYMILKVESKENYP